MKICNKCKQSLLLEQFHKCKRSKDGLTSRCKSCKKQYYQENAEYFKQRSKQHYQDNPEYFKQYGKQWSQNNSEKRKQYMEQWRQDNSEYHKQWFQDNLEYKKQYQKQLSSSIEPGIYMVKCLLNGNCYIGQSVTPYQRKTQHFSIYQCKKTQTSPKLQADLKQYGKNAFVFGIIEHCESEQLLEREKYWIQNLNPTYNTKLN